MSCLCHLSVTPGGISYEVLKQPEYGAREFNHTFGPSNLLFLGRGNGTSVEWLGGLSSDWKTGCKQGPLEASRLEQPSGLIESSFLDTWSGIDIPGQPNPLAPLTWPCSMHPGNANRTFGVGQCSPRNKSTPTPYPEGGEQGVCLPSAAVCPITSLGVVVWRYIVETILDMSQTAVTLKSKGTPCQTAQLASF